MRHEFSSDHVREYIAQTATTVSGLQNQAGEIARIGAHVVNALKNGGKVLTAGNGGSAAEAMHLAEELTGKYRKVRKALPAICLNSDPTALTCIANDWDFNHVFARQVEAFARPGDVLVVFSTSGNSENCLRAAQAMKAAGGIVIGLLGSGGGKIKPACDIPLVVESPATNHVQEAHQVVLHLILEHVESAFA